MSDQEETSSRKKDPEVISDSSLAALAKEMTSQGKGLVFTMMLNVPTLQLAVMLQDGHDKDCTEEDMCMKMLLHWKDSKKCAKDKDKVTALEQACRQMGQLDLADTILDRHSNNMELTEDCFPTPD